MKYSLGLGVGVGKRRVELFPTIPSGSPPLWAELAVHLPYPPSHLPYPPSLGYCHDIIKLLLQGSWNSTAESWKKGKLGEWIGWPEAGWSRGAWVVGGEALVSLTGCSPSSFLLFNPKQEKMETTEAQRSLGKKKVHILLECLSPLLVYIGTS